MFYNFIEGAGSASGYPRGPAGNGGGGYPSNGNGGGYPPMETAGDTHRTEMVGATPQTATAAVTPPMETEAVTLEMGNTRGVMAMAGINIDCSHVNLFSDIVLRWLKVYYLCDSINFQNGR